MSKFGYVFEKLSKRRQKDGLYHSLCSVCRMGTSNKAFYILWHHGSWFRGEDERLGIYCYNCCLKFKEEHREELL